MAPVQAPGPRPYIGRYFRLVQYKCRGVWGRARPGKFENLNCLRKNLEAIPSHRIDPALVHNARKPISWLSGALLTEKRRQAAERTPGNSPMPKCKRKIKKAWFASFDPAYWTYGYGRIGPAASYLRRSCR